MSDYYDDNAGDQVEDGGDGWEVEQPAGPANATFAKQVKAAEYTVAAMVEKLGFSIDQGDPEAAMIRTNHPDPAKWADDYADALAAKAARLGVRIKRTGGQQQPAASKQPAQPKSTPARDYVKEIDAAIARGAGHLEKCNIRAKYRRLGVNVDNARGGG